MLTGTIKFFNKPKGFGFITPDGGGKEVFLPSATVTASGLKKIEPGQRVSFREEADVKGPKAVELTLLDEPRVVLPPKPQAAAPQPPQHQQPKAAAISLYYDPASASFEAVQEALAEREPNAALIDYTATPPEPAELKKWSLALAGSGAGLVRRSNPMFFALQLDDRFLSESDFWLAISQHPTLINGPLLKAGGRMAIAKSAGDVQRFLGSEADEPAKPKGLSARLSAMLRGEAVPPLEEDDEDEDDVAVEAAAMVEEIEAPVAKAKPVKKAAPVKKDAAKPKAAVAKKPAAKKR